VEVTGSDNHSNLLQCSVYHGNCKFYGTGSRYQHEHGLLLNADIDLRFQWPNSDQVSAFYKKRDLIMLWQML
jgi:hypothetical protein